MRLSKRLTAMLLALALLTAVAAVAQDEEAAAAAGPRYPFFYVIKAKVDPTKIEEYAGAVGQVVAAHKQHDNGNVWAAFSTLTGGPAAKFYYFVPMQGVGDMDGWTPNAQVMSEVLGEEAAAQSLQTMSNVSKSKNMILAFNPRLSNADPSAPPGAPNFVWTIHAKVEAGMMEKYTALVEKLKEAHQAHENGFNWTAYTPIVGGQAGDVYFFIGMDKMGDIDGWTPVQQIEAAHMGAEMASKARKKAAEIAESTSMILALSPGLSNLPPGGDGE